MANFKHGICNCTNDVGLCCAATFAPCVIAGQNAKYVGDNCFIYGYLSSTVLGSFSKALTREKIRKRYHINVSFINKFCIN